MRHTYMSAESTHSSQLPKIGIYMIQFLRDDNGATAIEYGLIAGLIGVAIIGAVTALGTTLGSLFTSVSNSMNPTIGN